MQKKLECVTGHDLSYQYKKQRGYRIFLPNPSRGGEKVSIAPHEKDRKEGFVQTRENEIDPLQIGTESCKNYYKEGPFLTYKL